MNVSKFPYEYEAERHERLQETINHVIEQSKKKQEQIRQETHTTWRQKGPAFLLLFWGIGFFGCLGCCFYEEYAWKSLGIAYNGKFSNIGIGFAIVGGILGIICCFFALFGDKAREEKANGENELKICELRNEETKNLSKTIEAIKREAQNDCKRYALVFEDAARRESVKYADSAFVKSILEWIMFDQKNESEGRIRTRRNVETPFNFAVFSNKVACMYGTYDFFSNKQPTLSSPVEQAALTRAIAIGMMGIIAIIYTDKETGTKPVPEVEYTYRDSSALAKIDIPFEEW